MEERRYKFIQRQTRLPCTERLRRENSIPAPRVLIVTMPLNLPADLNTPVLNLFSLQGKVAIVTGGSRGIGLQVVTALAEAGADVAFIYLQHPDADDTAAKVAAQTGRRVQAFQCDVTNRQDISKTIHHITNTFGHGVLDIMVANAGVCQNVPSLQYTEQTWEYINKVNYDGAMWTAIPAGEIFKRQGYGSLIVTASVSATLINWPQTQAAYNASKAAVLQLARGLAVEWADFARVNCVSPGYVHTESKQIFLMQHELLNMLMPNAQ